MKNKVIIRREILQKRDALSDCERTKKKRTYLSAIND